MRTAFLVMTAVLTCVTLAAAPAPAARRKALSDLQTGSFSRKVAALESLAKAKDPTVVPQVLLALNDKDATVRWAAVEALEALGDPRALDALKTAAQDPAPLVARRAVAAVAVLSHNATPVRTLSVVVESQPSDEPVPDKVLTELATGTGRGLTGKGVALAEQAPTATHHLSVSVRSIKERRHAGHGVLEVACGAVLTELPGNQLRFSTRVAAALPFQGTLSARERDGMVADAVGAAAAALGEEAAAHLKSASR